MAEPPGSEAALLLHQAAEPKSADLHPRPAEGGCAQPTAAGSSITPGIVSAVASSLSIPRVQRLTTSLLPPVRQALCGSPIHLGWISPEMEAGGNCSFRPVITPCDFACLTQGSQLPRLSGETPTAARSNSGRFPVSLAEYAWCPAQPRCSGSAAERLGSGKRPITRPKKGAHRAIAARAPQEEPVAARRGAHDNASASLPLCLGGELSLPSAPAGARGEIRGAAPGAAQACPRLKSINPPG
jgi:hypothetical protein